MHPIKRQGLKIEATDYLRRRQPLEVRILEYRVSGLLVRSALRQLFWGEIARMRVAEGASGQRAAPLQGGAGITSTYLAPFSGGVFSNPVLTLFPLYNRKSL
jgi:hypothetical protein